MMNLNLYQVELRKKKSDPMFCNVVGVDARVARRVALEYHPGFRVAHCVWIQGVHRVPTQDSGIWLTALL